MAVNSTTIEKFIPIIYVPKQSEKKYFRSDVLCEIFPIFAVLWYHWPEDDKTRKADYEPVILIFRSDSLVAIGIRPHKEYKYATKWLTEGSRPVIVFQSSWHAPIINTGSFRDTLTPVFTSSLFSDKITEYNLVYRKPPRWYIKDGTETDVYEYAKQLANNIR
jgi:hypothetical protein